MTDTLVTSVEFLALYGAAMSQWAKVERNMEVAFIVFSGTDQAIASAIYHHIRSTESRIAMMEEVFSAVERTPEHTSMWKAARSQIKTANTHRNRLAHYQVTRTTQAGRPNEPPDFKLEPHFRAGRVSPKKPVAYRKRDLERLIAEFQMAGRVLSQLAFYMQTGKHLSDDMADI